MSLIYVTGAPGVGKTTLHNEFINRGYDARDIDDPSLGGPHNISTGERVIIPSAAERTPDWFKKHEWRVYSHAFNELRRASSTEDILVFGVAASDNEILHVFDKIIYLSLDDDSLASRLLNRQGNDYGKNPYELNEILDRKRRLDEKYASMGVVSIDAARPLNDVADDIASNL